MHARSCRPALLMGKDAGRGAGHAGHAFLVSAPGAHARAASAPLEARAAYLLNQTCVFLVRPIFFCSWSRPYMRASAVGGQPGT